MAVTESEDVLVASKQASLTMPSNCAMSWRLASSCSTMASTTTSQSAMPESASKATS
jgi:hypothetical protein